MKLKGRQSTNIVDRRVERDLEKPLLQNGTSPAEDPASVSRSKAKADMYKARIAAMPMLGLYRPKKKAKF